MSQASRFVVRSLLPLVAAALIAPSASASSTTDGEQELVCRDHWFAFRHCQNRRPAGPVLMLGGDFGVAAMNESGAFGFRNGLGSATQAGPAWGLRVGVELLSWLAFEARYVGMYDGVQSSLSPAGTLGYVTTGGEAVARFTAPLPFVHPYIFGGIGYYDSALAGSSAAHAGSVMTSSAEPGIPLGFGFDVPLTWHVSVGAEATYHFLIGERFSSVMTNGIDGGDVTSFRAVLRFRL
jgi:hypothetical protein